MMMFKDLKLIQQQNVSLLMIQLKLYLVMSSSLAKILNLRLKQCQSQINIFKTKISSILIILLHKKSKRKLKKVQKRQLKMTFSLSISDKTKKSKVLLPKSSRIYSISQISQIRLRKLLITLQVQIHSQLSMIPYQTGLLFKNKNLSSPCHFKPPQVHK